MKRSYILSLLSLAIPLATLPAAGQVVYDHLENIKHLERIPVTVDGSNNSAKLTVPINETSIGNLLDGDKSSSWQSWVSRVKSEQKIEGNEYSANYTHQCSILDDVHPVLKSEGDNYYLSMHTTGLGTFKVYSGMDFKNNPARSSIKFDIETQGTVNGNVRILIGNSSQNTTATDENSFILPIKTENSITTVSLPAFTSTEDGGSDWIWIDASEYGGDITVKSITSFVVDSYSVSQLTLNSYEGKVTSDYVLDSTNTISINTNNALVVSTSEKKPFHIILIDHLSLASQCKVRMRIRGDNTGEVTVTLNNQGGFDNANHVPVSTDWNIVETSWRTRADVNFGNPDFFSVFSHNYMGKIDIDWFEIIQLNEANDGYVNSEESQSLISRQDFNWSSFPDENKNGSYIPGFSNEASGDATDTGFVTFRDYSTYRQFCILDDVKLKKGKQYRFEVEVKANMSDAVRLSLVNPNNFGMATGSTNVQTYGSEWTVLSFEFDNLDELSKFFSGAESERFVNLIFPAAYSSANLQFRSIRILELPEDGGHVETQTYDLSKGWPFSGAGTVDVVDGAGVIHVGPDYNRQVAIFRESFKKGRKYTLKAKMKCEGADLDLTHYQQYCMLKYGWEDNAVVGYLDKKLTAGADWEEVTMSFGPMTEDKSTFINFFNYGWGGDNKLYIKDIEFITSTEDEDNEMVVFSSLDASDPIYQSLNNDDTSFVYFGDEQVLYAECNFQSIRGLVGLDLDPHKNYRVSMRVKADNADGDFNIKLGDDSYLHKAVIPITTTDWTTVSADFFGVGGSGKSYCVLQPGSSMSGEVIVNRVEIVEVTPAVTDESSMGYDYFDVTLPHTIQAEDVYFLQVRRGLSGAPDGADPMRFRVVALNQSGASVNEGAYAIGGFSEMSKALYQESVYDKNVALSQFVRIEISNTPPVGANVLRLYCTRNAGDRKVVLQKKEGDKVVNSSVPAIEMSEVGLYRLIGWKNTDAHANATWVMPVLSRFQLEANALRGNYPGECIKDAVEGFEKSRYTSVGGNLFDSSPSSYWQTSENKANDRNCIDLLLPEMINAKSGKKSIRTVIDEYRNSHNVDLLENGMVNLVVQFGRPRNNSINFPSEIRYCGSDSESPDFTEENWTTLPLPLADLEGDIYFSIPVNPSWKRLRIESVEGSNGSASVFGLAELRAYLEFPKIDLDEFDYDILYNDRYFDYELSDRGDGIDSYRLSQFGWNHTQGVVADINNPIPYENRKDGNVSDSYKWADRWTNDFIDVLNGYSIGNSSVALGKFDYVTAAAPDDSDGLNATQSAKLNGKRQRTYVVTHDIYTLPGKRVDLYPYSDIHSSAYYEDQFVRWYDYLSDGTPDNLYFFTDPKSVIKTQNNGFYGSRVILDPINRGPGTVGSVYFGKKDGSYDYNISDQWIAADFSICLVDSNFVSGFTDRFKRDSKTIEEPIITFRHLFHIRDGKTFAEDFSGSYEANVTYNRKNRKYISARAGADFTIRLDNAMPLGSSYADLDGGDDSTKSAYFYKRSSNGQPEYVRVCSYDIVAYRSDDAEFAAILRDIDTGNYKNKAEGEMFSPYDRSFYVNVGSIISSTLEDTDDGVNWVPNNRGFARAIYCPKEKAKAGKYLVRLYGLDKDGKVITIDGSGNKPLVVAEYEVTFLPEEMASFVPEHRLRNLKPNDVLYSHTEDYLESTYNSDGNARKAVNFDKFSVYNLQKGIDNNSLNITEADLSRIIYSRNPVQLTVTEGEYTGGGSDDLYEVPAEGLQSGHYLKLPLEWTVSNYGFGFDKNGDYNIFRLADHSSATVYNSAATRRTADSNPVDKTLDSPSRQRGVYDRLFYNSDGEEKGMFYYVNAASDPGDIVEINIDDPCPGATLYVSGWVNEFNDHQRETANIIVNYYANITEELDENKKAKKDGKITRRIQMKGFETGYVPNHSNEMAMIFDEGKQGDWMHFYFSFVPNIQRVIETLDSDKEAIANYSLVLENNSISSWGADYAIDDIRAYVAPPRVEAYQTKPICNSKSSDENLQIEVRLPYDALIESLGISEPENASDGKYESLQYAILDKDEYDKAYKEASEKYQNPDDNEADIMREAFTKSVLKYPHVHIDKEADQSNTAKEIPWGTIYFNTFYEGNLTWNLNNSSGDSDASGDVPHNRAMKHSEDGERNISFITTPPMVPEKRDYIIVIGQFGSSDIFESGSINVDRYENRPEHDLLLAQAFDFGSHCCRTAEFTLNMAAQKVVDGMLYADDDQITCCENQSPVVQLNLYRNQKDSGNIYDEDDEKHSMLWENPYLDWYAGKYEDFMEQEMPDRTSLWEVLADFRTDYPTSTTWDMPCVGEDDYKAAGGKYTDAKRDYLKSFCEEGKLGLYQASFVFPKVVLDRDQDGNLLKDGNGYEINYKDYYVTAVPIDGNAELTSEEYIVCIEPTEVKIRVSNTSPKMNNGFASGINYPEGMDVVPLRIGLSQLDATSIEGDEWIPAQDSNAKEQLQLNIVKYEGEETLVIPLRDLGFATDGVTRFLRIEGDPFCYLVETNDPYYRQLGQVAMSYSSGDASQGEIVVTQSADKYDSDFGLTPRGVIAVDTSASNDYFSNVKITFNEKEMAFHEGYYYTFKFAYEEDYSAEGVQKPNVEEEIPCRGQTLFTIKVVPEYQVWTGETSLNWNNDENWRRVSTDDLLATGDAPSAKASDRRFTTDGSNNQTFSYAPLNFTKVIIPAGTTYPQLAARAHDRSSTNGATTVNNGYKSISYFWAAEAPNAAKQAGASGVSVEVGDANSSSYHPTLYVQYDMAATTYDADVNVYCRPWYANACEQIHFDSNAEILNQQYLDYEKAWVDMEMAPHRWYNVASPLYGVVAGDMYLPTADAANKNAEPGRQMTELFTPINYDKDLNDRFAPAVYQRGWDKGTETVYTVHNSEVTEKESVALASTWSHVYNDVTEVYTPGMGFSVKSDVTRLPKYQDGVPEDEKQTLVKFRFPKADETYNYFEDGKDAEGELNHKTLNRVNAHKLFAVSETGSTVPLTKKNAGKLFLVGNPFMAHLDMAKFLKANEGVIESKYWLLSEGEGQTGVVMAHDKEGSMIANETLTSGNVTSASSNTGLLAPMQGFFVQAASDATTLEIKFTPDMMAVQAYTASDGAPILKAPRPETRAEGEDIIRVSTEESTAIIRLSGSAKKDYVASEDVEMIDDSNQRGIRRIYTVAGTMASAINQTPDADGVEVGLMAPMDSVTVVTFNGVALEDYLLYDTATGEKTQLYDGFELEVVGGVSGRYYLTNGIDTVEIEDASIRIMPLGHEVVVKAPAVCGELTVRVFDTLGREVAKAEGFEQEVRIALAPGIYVVEVSGSNSGHRTGKLSLN